MEKNILRLASHSQFDLAGHFETPITCHIAKFGKCVFANLLSSGSPILLELLHVLLLSWNIETE